MKKIILTFFLALCAVAFSFAATTVSNTTVNIDNVTFSSTSSDNSVVIDFVSACTVSITKTFTDSNGDIWRIIATGTASDGDCGAAYQACINAINAKINEM
jgi:beta-lactam-binding protein with PASTA domain